MPATKLKIYPGMIPTPALPELHRIAAECGGGICHLDNFSNLWPNRSTDPGDRNDFGGSVLVAQGWDGNLLFGVTAPEPIEPDLD